VSSLQETIYKIIEDIDNRDFKNCKRDCYGTSCKYIKDCSWYHYKHREEFALQDLIEQF
jgi:hypothetical protein